MFYSCTCTEENVTYGMLYTIKMILFIYVCTIGISKNKVETRETISMNIENQQSI